MKPTGIMPTNDIICYGVQIRLRHQTTGALLTSKDRPYTHNGTSGQPIVGGSAKKDDLNIWLVKPSHERRDDNILDAPVVNGETIRLEHVSTQSYADRK